MKKLITTLIVLILLTNTAVAQNAVERTAGFINNNDFYALERLAPEVRDSLPPLFNHLIDATVGSRFNELPRSCKAIETLLNEYSTELDGPTQSWLFGMLLGNLRLMNEYEQAAGIVAVLKGASAEGDTESQATLDGMARWFGTMATYPKTSITRPAAEITLPLYVTTEHTRNALGEPTDIRVLYTDVEIGDTTERMIFDTGCSHATFISQEFADRHGIRIICDSIIVSGAATNSYARVGVLDSMRVGPVTLHNPMFIIAPAVEAVDTLHKVRAVLGTDFMVLAGELQLFPAEGKIVLPAAQTPTPASGRNLSLDTSSGQYSLRASCDGEPVTMIFDTGCVFSAMTSTWFEKHKKRVEIEGIRKEMGIGGFGGVTRGWGYELPIIRFGIGGTEDTETVCTLHNVKVQSNIYSPLDNDSDGWLGTDFMLELKKMTINFDRMFVTAE